LVSLSNLDYLYLNNNLLSGSVPAKFPRSLQYLRLSNNQFTGHIPSALGNLANLRYLNLDSNQLIGHIPWSLGNLTILVELHLFQNRLTDTIPSSLGNCTGLTYLALANNKLTGNVPSAFSNLLNLQVLKVGYNFLSGTVPSFLSALPALRNLDVVHNRYTFDGMETLVQSTIDTLKYNFQRQINLHQNSDTLSVYAGGTLGNNTYTWFKDGALVATIKGDSTFTPGASGNYNVLVTNAVATALTLKSDTLFYSGDGLIADDLIAYNNTAFSVYPNPAKTMVTVAFNAIGNCTLKLTDVSGITLQTKTVIAVKSANVIQIDVSRYPAGVYFVSLSNESKQTQTIQLNKQ
jgi:hypothetical protein